MAKGLADLWWGVEGRTARTTQDQRNTRREREKKKKKKRSKIADSNTIKRRRRRSGKAQAPAGQTRPGEARLQDGGW
jgi:hypothetical protein